MMLVIAKLLSITLGLTVILKIYHDFKKGKESLVMFLFWVLTWMVIITITLFPSIIDMILYYSRGERIGIGTFLGMAIVFLFFVIYRVYIKADRIEKNMATIVRQMATKNDFSKKNKKTLTDH